MVIDPRRDPIVDCTDISVKGAITRFGYVYLFCILMQ